MAEIICPQCKAVNKDTARYCSECGASLLGSTPLPPESRASETSLKTGLLLQDRYRIVKELGRGGFGAVYRAWDTRLNKAVAVKENMETSPEAQRQFAREALVLANLSHPNLPRVTDHFSLPGQGQYLVMDYVEGEDLETQVRTQGVISVEQALTWIIQVADALEYMHNQEPPVFHRDVKPANVRITPKGKAMLVDFGLVKVSAPQMKTTMGARAISPGYAPPEQYGQGRTDSRTDIYSLAATLYRLVTGYEPLESVLRMTRDALIPADRANAEVPAQVSRAIEQGMALDPEKRFQSAEAFKSALQEGLAIVRASSHGSVKPVVGSAHPMQAQPYVEAPFQPVSRPPVEGEVLRTQVIRSEQLASEQPASVAPGTPIRTQMVESIQDMVMSPSGQQPARRFPRWLLFAGIGGIVLVLLVIAGVAVFALGGGGASSKTATAEVENTMLARVQATQTRVAQTAANNRATATIQAQNPAATQAQVTTAQLQTSQTAQACQALLASQPLLGNQCWPIVFQDSFDNDINEWSRDKTEDSWGSYQIEVRGGVYHMDMKTKEKGYIFVDLHEIPTGEEFLLSMRTRHTGGSNDSWTGLVFHGEDIKNLYLFAIKDDGQFGFWSVKDDEWKEILPKNKTNAFRTASWNELAVSGQGSLFKFFVNGTLVGQASDTTFSSGFAGVYFESGTDLTVVAEVDDFTLYAPGLSMSQPMPSPQQATSLPQDTPEATISAKTSFLASLGVNATPELKYGPGSGSLPHDPSDGSLSYKCFSLNMRNFMLQVNFNAPYSSGSLAWDFGILFRVAAHPNYRIILHGDTKWILENYKNAANDYVEIANGKASSLRSNQGDSNLIQLVVMDNQGWLLVNDSQSNKLDLSANSDSGDVCIAIGFYQNTEIAGKETPYSDLMVWELR